MLLAINDRDFSRYQALLYQQAGIRLSAEKKPLLCGRLAKRLKERGVTSYADYFTLISRGDDAGELQAAIDLLTTNETYFFREPKHFDFLVRHAGAAKPALGASRPYRVWSAAASSGEEAYSIAMILAETLGEAPWEILGTDISSRIVERARSAHYPMERAKGIPQAYLPRYCLKGTGAQEGTLLIQRRLRDRVAFRRLNLLDLAHDLGSFDVVFLRNVLIYFDLPTKRQVVESVAARIKPGGYLLAGHSESLNGLTGAVSAEGPAIYRKT